MPIDVQSRQGSTTVRIYEASNNGWPSWFVVYRFQGRRQRKRFSDLTEAREFAQEQADNIANGKTAAMNLTNSELASCARALEIARKVGKPIELIASEYAEAHAGLNGVPVLTAIADYKRRHAVGVLKSIPDVVTEFLATKTNRAGDYRRLMESRLERFRGDFNNLIGSLTGSAVDQWLSRLKVGPRTRRNYLADVRAVVRFAIKKRYLPPGFDELESIELPESAPGKIQPFTPEEMRKILDYAQGHAPRFLPYLPIRAFTGIRYQEMMRIRAEHFHKSGWISMDAEITKTNHRRLIPIHPVLKKWLKHYPVKDGQLIPGNEIALAPRLVELVRAAGVTTRRNGLRDSYVSYRMAQVQDAGKVAEETGHSVDVMRRSYREIRMPDGRVITPKEARKWFDLCPNLSLLPGRKRKRSKTPTK